MRYQTLISLAVLPTAFGQLNKLAKAKGFKYFGTATDNPELTDSAYKAILTNNSEWGQITVGNTQKWEYVEPTQDVYDYTQGDAIVSLAQANGQILRCHNLVWYNQLPNWVTSGTWTNATLIAALKAHITNEVTHYKGKCYAWDVVNEAFNDDGTYRTDVFYNTIGPEYIPIAFEAAAAADSTVKLYYNDYNIESAGAKVTAVQALVKSLKARGIKIDGVGIQGHLIVGETPSQSSQVANLQSFVALGVEVAYTELDVRFLSLPPTAAGLTQQTADYVSTVGACLSIVPSCVGVTVWDFDDAYSWIPGTFAGEGDADLFYANLTRIPAYYGLVSLFGGAASVTSTSATLHTTTKTTSTTTGKATTTGKSTSAPATTTSTSACTVPHWNQCGGLTYTGCTVCAAGYTCKYSSDYYSQCL